MGNQLYQLCSGESFGPANNALLRKLNALKFNARFLPLLIFHMHILSDSREFEILLEIFFL